MIFYGIVVLFFYTSTLILPYGSCIQTVLANSSPCESNQTECLFGCCPFSDAVCCVDGFECCHEKQTCIPYIGICIGLFTVDGQTSLSSSKSIPVKSSVTDCPRGTTECGKDKCCRYPHATCCSDGEHCCPMGYSCDLIHKTCNKTSNDKKWSWTGMKSAVKSSFRRCMGFGPTIPCPSFMHCCIDEEGEQSCCLN